ncbi:MAG: NAD(P)-dependent oxidoreductase, partial [Ilumatobacteraceae bacterium]
MRIGCVGLGNIGRHLAANLVAAGFDVVVHDLHRTAAEPLEEAGATWAESPAAVAALCDAVVTCLPSVAAITTVVAGENGLLDGFRPGSTWIDMSTNDRHELLRLAGLLAERGVHTLEAPVTGGAHNASSATITVLVGGDEAEFQRFAPVFSAVGGRVFYMGELGQAAVIKVITNMLAFIHIAATAEAYMLAARAGIDLRQAWEVIKASSGNSFIHETESTTILSGSYDIGFSLDLSCKDLGFATQLGRELDVPLDIAATVEQLNIRARAAYGGGAGSPMVARLLEEACGLDLRAPG